MDLRVGEHRYELIGKDGEGDTHLVVAKDQKEHIKNERHVSVDQDDITEIGKDRHLNVKGKQAVEVKESNSLTVTGDQIEVFKANHSEQVTQNYYVKALGIVIEASSGVTIKCGGNAVVVGLPFQNGLDLVSAQHFE